MDKNVSKKRGRKPKGGKIIENLPPDVCEKAPMNQNIILHLKCFARDLDPKILPNIIVEPYSVDTQFADVSNIPSTDNSVNAKLKDISIRMHTNDVSKRSDCFWCTCPFESPPVYIPQSKCPKGLFKVYGSFCCPECAAAFLFSDIRLDDTIRFERYHLLNFLYGKALNYERNIMPAPPPHFLLEKFYGSLTIEEYRLLIKGTAVAVAEKPICLNFPEVGEIRSDLAPKMDATGYKLCRKKTKSLEP